MAFSFSDLQAEVKRRSTLDQGGTTFDTATKNIINTSLWRVAREAKWRSLRRTATFNTVAPYSTGTASCTNGSNSVTLSGSLLLSNDTHVGRYITFSGSSKFFKITAISSNTALSIDQDYDGTTDSGLTYSILGQEEYTLPIQIGHSAFLWHRGYGWPLKMEYVPTQEFYGAGVIDTLQNVPTTYRMWGCDSAIEQPKSQSVISISSSSSSDTSISVTVFGTVSGYPDYEIITTNASNGTTASAGSKSFTYVERIVKNQNTVGRITLTANTASTTVGVLPVGNTTTGPYYTKVQLYPLPTTVFPINVFYYKKPYQLVNDGDVHELGEDFNEAIILLSVAKMNAAQNKKEDADFFKLYQDEINNLKSTNVDKIDWRVVLQRPDFDSSSMFTGGLRYAQIGNSGMFGPSSRY
jgi:hypothetical protein